MERIKLDKHVRFYKHAKINFIFDGHEMRQGKGGKLFLILPSTTRLDIWFTSSRNPSDAQERYITYRMAAKNKKP